MQLQDAVDAFHLQLQADGRSPHTIGTYRRHLRALLGWLGPGATLDALDHETVARFVLSPAARNRPDGKPKAAVSLNSLRTSMRMFCSYCHAAGWAPHNAARMLRRAITSPPPPRHLEDAEVTGLLGVISDPRDRALFGLMVATGIRLGAAVGLDVEDVDLARGEILITTKGDRRDRVYLSTRAREELRAWIGSRASGPLFTSRSGRRISARHVRRRLEHWMGQAGLRGSPHTLRHSFATRMLRVSGDLALVKEALGHRSIASTVIYARCDPRGLRAALEG